MYNVRFVIEYDGTTFHGWQQQSEGTQTVQSELRRALRIALKYDVHPIYASGRTDAGVHARGQVVNFFLPERVDLRRLSFSVSSILRERLAVLSADYVPAHFNARASAMRKQYSYRLLPRASAATLDRDRVWRYGSHLDVEAMMDAARCLEGVHDYSSFRAAQCSARSPIRQIFSSALTRNGPYLDYRVVGNGFLRNMVRIIVGTLVEIGDGTLTASMAEILASRDRAKAGITAPPYGLFLDWVEYPEEFAIAHEQSGPE